MKTITWLSPQDAPEWFPPLEQALEEPSGLLAAGGDLSPERLIAAYLVREGAAVESYADEVQEHVPFRGRRSARQSA